MKEWKLLLSQSLARSLLIIDVGWLSGWLLLFALKSRGKITIITIIIVVMMMMMIVIWRWIECKIETLFFILSERRNFLSWEKWKRSVASWRRFDSAWLAKLTGGFLNIYHLSNQLQPGLRAHTGERLYWLAARMITIDSRLIKEELRWPASACTVTVTVISFVVSQLAS